MFQLANSVFDLPAREADLDCDGSHPRARHMADAGVTLSASLVAAIAAPTACFGQYVSHDLARNASAWDVFARRAHLPSWSRSASLSISPAFGRSGRAPSASPPGPTSTKHRNTVWRFARAAQVISPVPWSRPSKDERT
jgi:hypothetical protein